MEPKPKLKADKSSNDCLIDSVSTMTNDLKKLIFGLAVDTSNDLISSNSSHNSLSNFNSSQNETNSHSNFPDQKSPKNDQKSSKNDQKSPKNDQIKNDLKTPKKAFNCQDFAEWIKISESWSQQPTEKNFCPWTSTYEQNLFSPFSPSFASPIWAEPEAAKNGQDIYRSWSTAKGLKITIPGENTEAEEKNPLVLCPQNELLDGTYVVQKENSLNNSLPPIGTPKSMQSRLRNVNKMFFKSHSGIFDIFKHGDHYTETDLLKNGFLVATHLVKTAAADQAGLAVGDIFVKFGQIEKSNFENLDNISDYVRNCPNRQIHTIVLRSASFPSNNESKYQCKHLILKPVSSKDIGGGGVIGAVVNVWPLPKPFDN